MTDWLEFLDANQTRFENELLEFVKIPSVSASSEYIKDVEEAASWVSKRLEIAGVENTEIMPTGGHPVVYGDWLHAGEFKTYCPHIRPFRCPTSRTF
jgi:acetylornithine deacetylase/succinyl-diaminopimelate desuccinylase-like protein